MKFSTKEYYKKTQLILYKNKINLLFDVNFNYMVFTPMSKLSVLYIIHNLLTIILLYVITIKLIENKNYNIYMSLESIKLKIKGELVLINKFRKKIKLIFKHISKFHFESLLIYYIYISKILFEFYANYILGFKIS